MSRGTWETNKRVVSAFAYGAITLYRRSFQRPSANTTICNSPPPPRGGKLVPTTPATQRSRTLTRDRFGLIPVRSPLLRESRLLSVPAGTEMVHFPALAPPSLCVQEGVTGHDPGRVSPFGHPRVEACLPLTEAYRSLLRPSSPSCTKASTVRP